jgi:DNA damage-inducible protein 1
MFLCGPHTSWCVFSPLQVKAFVDSGAQITIMSQRCAEACGVMHLVDTRMTTQLRGVGTSQTLGEQ